MAALILLIAIWMDRNSTSYLVTLTLMLLSVYATSGMGSGGLDSVVGFLRDPGHHWSVLDAFFIWLLLLAEGYAFVVLFLGYLQMLWPLRRTPVPLPEDTEEWPAVDLLIPTYNEPLNVVRYTALAAMNIDWPADKLNVYILDDGQAGGVSRVRRRGGHRLHDARRQRACEGREYQSRAGSGWMRRLWRSSIRTTCLRGVFCR